ncbi:MAG TPA: MFS transporter [Polyangiaceae bacterium]|nr:MFS transporter [Polyangiaceae bacterium]
MTRALAPIYLTVFVDVLALTLVLPLLPYYAEHFGASPFQVGLLFAAFSICQLVSGPLLGRLSDRIGRKPVLVSSQLGTFIGLLTIGFAPRLEFLFLGRIIDGLTAGNLTIAQAYIADVTKPEHRTRAFAFFGIAFGVGFLIGPMLSGFLAHAFGFSAPPLGAAGLSALSMVLSTSLLPKSAPPPSTGPRPSFASLAARPKPRARVAELFAYVFSFSMLTGGLAMFLQRRLDFDVREVGFAFGFSGLVGALVQGAVGPLSRKLGDLKLSAGGLLVMIAGYLALAQVHSIGMLALALGVGSLGSSVVRPALTSLLTQSVEESERGSALGMSQAASSLAQTLGPATAGLLIDRGALSGWAYCAAGLAFGALVVRWLLDAPSA